MLLSKAKFIWVVCTLIHFNLLFSQVTLDNLGYILNRQSFRKAHDLTLFREPQGQSCTAPKNYLKILSSSQISHNYPTNYTSIQLQLGSGKWALFTEPWIVNDEYGHDVLGASFSRFGIMGRYLQSYLLYSPDNFTFKLGRFRQRWGQSWSHSMMFSLYSLPFDQAYLEFSLGEWEFNLFGGSLSSEMVEGSRKINRHISGHRISRSFLENKLHAEAGEIVLYTGENRGWDIQYLSPFSLYYIDLFDPSNYNRRDTVKHNNENAIMFFTLRWIHANNLSFYSELLLDDFQVDDKGYQNKLGLKLGVDGALIIKSIPITYELEFTSINSWTYLNRGERTNFENLGHTLGNPYGPDNKSLRVQADGWLNKHMLFGIEYAYLEKGINTLQSTSNETDNLNTIKDSFPRPPVNYYNLVKLSLSCVLKYGSVGFGWSNIPFSNQIAYEGNPEIDGSFYLKLQGHYTFSGF